MSFYAVSALINFITSSILGIFVISKGRNSKNVGFAIFCLFIAFWSLPYFLWQVSQDSVSALFWARVLMAAAIFIPVTYLQFVFALVDLLQKRKKFLVVSYIIFSIFFLTNLTPLFVNHTEQVLNFQYWPIAGPAFSLFLVLWIFYAYYSFYLLLKAYKTSGGLFKVQLKYVAIGTILGWTGGITNYFLWYKLPIPPIGNITASVYLLFVAYAIIRYRFMDMRIVARKAFIYVGVTAFSYGIFYALIWFYNQFFGIVFPDIAITGLIVAPLLVFGFYGADKSMRLFANKYLFVSLYNYQETINKLNDELTDHIELRTIIDLIVGTIKDTMKLDRAGVLLVNGSVTPTHYQIAKVIGFNENNGISLVQDNFLTQHLLETQKPLVSDELVILARNSGNQEEKNSFIQLYENMKHIEASLCLPLISNKTLIGIIVLGSKISGNAYTQEDLELLSVLAKQASIAVENAKLYKEVQDFNATLKQKVDEQTKDIQEKAVRLEKTLKVKSEFIYLMSHQLRTPISVITGMTSMLKDGDMDNLPAEKKQEFYEGIFVKSKKLADILNDFIKAESMDGEDFKFAPEDIKKSSFEDIVKNVCNDLKSQADEKKISLEYEPPNSPTPPIMTDPHYLEQAVTNLVDNAIKYTQKGSVKAKVYEKDGEVTCEVSDSGIGIPDADKPRLFDKFVRAKNAVDAYAYGTGLGLFIVKKIVEAHQGGKVSFESVQNQGTTFRISIPVSVK